MENVISDNLDSVLHDDPIIKIMLLTLIKDNHIKGFSKVMSDELTNQRIEELENFLLE
jgi:hypothetical protein